MSVSYKNIEIEPFYVGGAYSSITRDGLIFASAVNEEVVISDLKEGKILNKLEGDGEDITSLQLAPNGKKLAILSGSQRAQIYDLETREVTHTHKLTAPVFATSCDSTSTLFAFGSTDGLIQVWDIDNGYVTHSLKGHASIVSSLRFYGQLNSSKWVLVSGDVSGVVKVWDLVKRKCVLTLNEHNSPVRGVDVSEDFLYLVSGGRDKVLNLFSLTVLGDKIKAKLLKTVPTGQLVEACGFMASGEVYFGGDECQLQIYDLIGSDDISDLRSTAKPLETSEEVMITQIGSLDGHRLCTVLSDQTVLIYDADSLQRELCYAGNQGIIAEMGFCGPQLDLVALATNSPDLRIISPFGNRMAVDILKGHRDLLNSLDVSDDGEWIATASKDHDVRLWHWSGTHFENVAVFQGHTGPVTAVCISKVFDTQPKFIVSGSGDLTVKKWEVPKLQGGVAEVTAARFTRKAHDKDINSIDLSPNDQFFATASFDKTAKIWDCSTGETVGILKGHKRGLWKIRFCPFDKVVLTCSGDKTLKLWSLQTYQCTRTFEGHTNSVLNCRFINRKQLLTNDVSSDLEVNFKKSSNEILSCGADGLVKIWDMNSGEIIVTLDAHDDKIWSISVKDHGKNFISADSEGKITLWEDNTLELLKKKQKDGKLLVEQQQSLLNYIREEKWDQAFKLALKLNHPMKLYHVLKASLTAAKDQDGILGSRDLDRCIENLTDEELLAIFQKLRNWNTNFKYFEVSQNLIKCCLQYHSVAKLTEIPGLVKLVDSIIAYNQRHFQRLDGLIEESYILDYTVHEMGI